MKVKTFVVPGSTEVHADMKRLNLRGMPKSATERSIEEKLLDPKQNLEAGTYCVG